MIIAGSKFTGKKLTNAIVNAVKTDGYVQVAAMSDRGVHQINNAGQKAANTLGYKITATSSQGEVTLDGILRVALIVELRPQEENE